MESRRRLEDRARRLAVRNETLIAERDAAKGDASACAHVLEEVAGELSRAKDVIAQVVTAAGHPDSAVQDARQFADALVEQLAAARVDIRLELHRMEGARL